MPCEETRFLNETHMKDDFKFKTLKCITIFVIFAIIRI